jgi:hypothetical protein
MPVIRTLIVASIITSITYYFSTLAFNNGGPVNKSTPTSEFKPVAGNKLSSVCIDGVQYWLYRTSLAPRYDKESKDVMLCDVEQKISNPSINPP